MNCPLSTADRLRAPEDVLPGGFARWEIDRDSCDMVGDLWRAFGDAPRPLELTSEALQRSGEATVFDGGCGTGRALWDIASRSTQGFDAPVQLHAVGLNMQDYSQESGDVAVRRAVRERQIDYRLGTLESIPFESETFDTAWSYEVLVHCPQTAPRIVRELIRIVKPGGMVFCNMDASQLAERGMVEALDTAGGPVEAMKLVSRAWNAGQPKVRAICRIQKV